MDNYRNAFFFLYGLKVCIVVLQMGWSHFVSGGARGFLCYCTYWISTISMVGDSVWGFRWYGCLVLTGQISVSRAESGRGDRLTGYAVIFLAVTGLLLFRPNVTAVSWDSEALLLTDLICIGPELCAGKLPDKYPIVFPGGN